MIRDDEDSSQLVVPVTELDHAQGPSSAQVTLVEYGDYQCPHCAAAHPVLKEVKRRMGNRLRFVFRNFPLNSAHPLAEFAAESAEAAGEQGKFWEMHDGLYEGQDNLGQQLVVKLAESLGLDQQKFVNALETRKFKDHVKKDFMGGVRSGVSGTPGLFINGKRYEESWDLESLHAALSAHLTQ